MICDLRGTLGWRLTPHARSAAVARGFAVADVLLTAVDPEIRYTQEDYGEGRAICQRGGLAVVVHLPSQTVITVLRRSVENWNDLVPHRMRLRSRAHKPGGREVSCRALSFVDLSCRGAW